MLYWIGFAIAIGSMVTWISVVTYALLKKE